MSVYETLSKINVNDRIEKKGNLSYLSWAWAWATVKSIYPATTYTIYHNADGLNYFTDGQTAWVEVGVTIEGQELIEHLPVMDYRMKSVSIDKLTSFDVNTAIKRCMTKAIALHGLGLYIYAGEDIPQDPAEQEQKRDRTFDIKVITELAKQKAMDAHFTNEGIVLKSGKVKPWDKLTDEEWADTKKKLKEMPTP